MEGYRIKLNGECDTGEYKCRAVKNNTVGLFDFTFDVRLGKLNKCNK